MRVFLTLIISCLLIFSVDRAHSASIDELKAKIGDRSNEIKELEREIAELDKNVQKTVEEKQSLNAELRRIDAIKKKLDADVKVTGKKIDLAELNITKLESDIANKSTRISFGHKTVGDSLRLINEIGDTSIIEIMLSGGTLSHLWNQISNLEELQAKTVGYVNDLESAKTELETDRNNLSVERGKLVVLSGQLIDQRKIAEENIKQKNRLIQTTNNKEANYRNLLAETEARKRAVESELAQFESELRVAIDPTKLPGTGLKILSWPLDNITITQYFGHTAFSKTQAIYNGNGHNGIDLRAAVGTPLRSAGRGVVVGVGDTDPVCYRASYGKWIMIDHKNGLSSIYGHLSLIKVVPGQEVSAGEIIGYTGNTGYATGPHLHFTVGASQAVKVGNLKSKVRGCGTYTIPLGPLNGYLDPLSYL